MADYPEHDKLRAVKTESQAIGGFIEWLREDGYDICRYSGRTGVYEPSGKRIEVWLAKYFDVDLHKLEIEKQAMLAKLRADHGTNP